MAFFLQLAFVQLLFKDSLYFFGKASIYQWRLDKAIQRRPLDAISSMWSHSVLLSAMEMSHTTQTVLVLACWLSSAVICTCVHVSCSLATATIPWQRLLHTKLQVVRLLF